MATVEAATTVTPAPAAPAPTPTAEATPAEKPPEPVVRKKPVADPAKLEALREAKGLKPKEGSPESPKGSAGETKPANGSAGAGQDATTAKPGSPADGDPDLAMRLARIARQEDALRAARAEAEAVKGDLTSWREFKELKGKAPAEALGKLFTPEEREQLYWLLNDEVLAKDPQKPKDAAQLAREEAEKLLAERDAKAKEEANAAQAARARAHAEGFAKSVSDAFDTEHAKYPLARGVEVALEEHSFKDGTKGEVLVFRHGDISLSMGAEFEKGTKHTPASVLQFFQTERERQLEAAGYTRQKVEAQSGGEKPQSPNTATAGWQAGSGPSAKDDAKLTVRQSAEAIKRKHFKR